LANLMPSRLLMTLERSTEAAPRPKRLLKLRQRSRRNQSRVNKHKLLKRRMRRKMVLARKGRRASRQHPKRPRQIFPKSLKYSTSAICELAKSLNAKYAKDLRSFILRKLTLEKASQEVSVQVLDNIARWKT